MPEFIAVVVLATLIGKVVDFLRYTAGALRGEGWNPVVTQAIAWVAGVVVVLLFAASQFASQVPIGETETLASLDGWSLTIVGLSATSLFSTLVDIRKAVDGSDSAVVPNLTKS